MTCITNSTPSEDNIFNSLSLNLTSSISWQHWPNIRLQRMKRFSSFFTNCSLLYVIHLLSFLQLWDRKQKILWRVCLAWPISEFVFYYFFCHSVRIFFSVTFQKLSSNHLNINISSFNFGRANFGFCYVQRRTEHFALRKMGVKLRPLKKNKRFDHQSFFSYRYMLAVKVLLVYCVHGSVNYYDSLCAYVFPAQIE